jgi:hypothetical protein
MSKQIRNAFFSETTKNPTATQRAGMGVGWGIRRGEIWGVMGRYRRGQGADR